MTIRIVSDSSSNLFSVPDVDYVTVPLKIMFGSREYIDRPGTDFEQMVLNLQKHKGPSTTPCPNVHDWLSMFDGHDEIFAVTISSGLSASYASAEMAQQQYLELHPQAKIHIFDSLATGPVLHLIIMKLREGIIAGKPYEQIKEETLAYQKNLRILYSLESLQNLARNGRVNTHIARIVEALNIRVIGHASEVGTIELLHRCHGERRALKTIVNEMAERGFSGGAVYIDHCLNSMAAKNLKTLIDKQFENCTVYVNPCTALCSYYADKGGLIIGYEVS